MERLIGNDPFQTAVLVLKRTHLGDVADFHPAELGFPRIERRWTDPVPLTEILCRRAGFMLFEHADDLAFAEPGLLQGGLLRGRGPQDSPPIVGSLYRLHVTTNTVMGST